jgi:hypothetical protein
MHHAKKLQLPMPRKRAPQRSHRRKRFLAIDRLEMRWMLAATSPDLFSLQSHADTYDQPFFVTGHTQVQTIGQVNGSPLYDLRVNLPGDQTIPITSKTRIQIDPSLDYLISFVTQLGDGSFGLESFDSTGRPLGTLAFPQNLDLSEGSSQASVQCNHDRAQCVHHERAIWFPL